MEQMTVPPEITKNRRAFINTRRYLIFLSQTNGYAKLLSFVSGDCFSQF